MSKVFPRSINVIWTMSQSIAVIIHNFRVNYINQLVSSIFICRLIAKQFWRNSNIFGIILRHQMADTRKIRHSTRFVPLIATTNAEPTIEIQWMWCNTECRTKYCEIFMIEKVIGDRMRRCHPPAIFYRPFYSSTSHDNTLAFAHVSHVPFTCACQKCEIWFFNGEFGMLSYS